MGGLNETTKAQDQCGESPMDVAGSLSALKAAVANREEDQRYRNTEKLHGLARAICDFGGPGDVREAMEALRPIACGVLAR